ncbi:hypothetical protein KVT40_007927 [Elsinoe batatas]|uniref:Glycosyl transferase CAP10 domain-containing protein n=1 Tax=Elsinoe batatas TaxID=2601811 RepID=A0A8K0KX22_9PEZI|nr:hypothetical protein KVT40_007927 [Elsinoe batatas]
MLFQIRHVLDRTIRAPVLAGLVIASLVIYGLLSVVHSGTTPPRHFPADEKETPNHKQVVPASWQRDPPESISPKDNFTFSQDTCQRNFPNLGVEIERGIVYSKSHGGVTVEDLDISWKESGLVRAMIYQRKLYVIEAKHSGSGYDVRRSVAILSSINRAILSSPEDVPNIEFVFSINDTPEKEYHGHKMWTLTRRENDESHWLMPDFGFWSWEMDLVGEYSQIRHKIELVEAPFKDKIAKAVWRGAGKANALRRQLLSATNGKAWADVKEIRWSSRATLSSSTKDDVLPMWDLCRYKYLIHTEGASYSGRGKYLQNCNSIVIMHDREWREHYDQLLVPEGPEQNFVQVKRDWRDLETKINWLEAHPVEAEQVAKKGTEVFRDRYLSPAAQACYWRELFTGWAQVSFKPHFYTRDAQGGVILRGTPYETFVLTAFDREGASCSGLGRVLRLCT